MTEDGVGEVTDFMPVTGTRATGNHRIVRMIRCVRGQMSFDVEIAPRFDYGRAPHHVHDASFSVYALLGLGFTAEAAAFTRWLHERVHEQAGESSGPLKIMYRVDGTSDLVEEKLDHWEGYRGRSGSATVPRISSSLTSTARRWTASTSPTSVA